MLQTAWDQIEKIYTLPHVNPQSIVEFKQLKDSQSSHTKKEGNPAHYCSFFLPYDKEKGMIYLGHHKKANDYIPPGGHIEPGETPLEAAIREAAEELGLTISPSQLEPWNLSVKQINRPESGCVAHYDIWFLLHVKVQPINYLQSEYHNADWFKIPDGLTKITRNPDFAQIISLLGQG